MLGSIAGDIIGSVFERWGNETKSTEFPLFTTISTFTDDTVLTMATAYAILNGSSYAEAYKVLGRRYPGRGYGGAFREWLQSDEFFSYNSWGNGSAMRVSPVGWAFNSIDEVLYEAQCSAEGTHNHPEGIKGAQAAALAVFLARKGTAKADICREISAHTGYDLDQALDDIRPTYSFDVSCQGSVPPSIVAFLESDSVEDAIRKAISLGGDADTMACIAGRIAEAYFREIPLEIEREVRARLPEEFLEILDTFRGQFIVRDQKR
jgi:ADP-ribosylglycohydrolase